MSVLSAGVLGPFCGTLTRTDHDLQGAESTPLACAPLPPVALSGKTAKNPHLRVKGSTCLYAWRGQAQQPSTTLIV